MKNTIQNKDGNKQVAALTKAEQEILLIYDHFKIKGKIPSPGLVNKQIDILKRRTNSGTDINYRFTCC